MSSTITAASTQMSQGSSGGMYFSKRRKKQTQMYKNCLFDYNGDVPTQEDSIHEVWRQIESQPMASILQDNLKDKVINPLQQFASVSIYSIKKQLGRKQDVQDLSEEEASINPFLIR